ncbi:hypothetical protein I551_5422 [Mycobacterium ulcerans str. Harvey]|uniref:Uncharacterized protein n=1 Tax=Mycobacterium ulcerans str. Harvey TaxID=1299332 RepID=A0ABN0QTF0_MYCUL|nr:hypothetical protein I551_5422 [Mycobacterium ulcerans str. Harvey]
MDDLLAAERRAIHATLSSDDAREGMMVFSRSARRCSTDPNGLGESEAVALLTRASTVAVSSGGQPGACQVISTRP